MKFLRDRRGTAYSIVLIACTLLMVSIIYVVSEPLVNKVFDTFNTELVDEGIVSERTRDTLMFQRGIWAALPFVFGVVLLLFWPVMRALMEKRGGD